MTTTLEQPRKPSKARPEVSLLADMSNAAEKRALMNAIAPLVGVYEVEIKPKRDMRTLRQLKWWWSCIVKPFYEYLRAQDYEVIDLEDAHDLIRGKFLRAPLKVDRDSGEVLKFRTKRTRELSPVEFADFAERARAWLQDKFGIVTQDPDPEWRSNQ